MPGDRGEGEGGHGGERLPLAGATVRAIAHATEDVERVRACVRALAGEGTTLQETRSRGYHHQAIRVVEADVRGARRLRALVHLLAGSPAATTYGHTWERRLDEEEGVLHFRLAKQPLLQGRLELEPAGGAGDLVKLEMKLLAYPARPERFREVARSLLD